MPSGCVLAWSGAPETIPDGWALCNGENGTPDLRNRFLLGAGTHTVGETGGSEAVTLTVAQIPEHSHGIHVGSASGSDTTDHIQASTSVARWGKNIFNSNIAGGSQPHTNMPPYYTLCYIMKL